MISVLEHLSYEVRLREMDWRRFQEVLIMALLWPHYVLPVLKGRLTVNEKGEWF